MVARRGTVPAPATDDAEPPQLFWDCVTDRSDLHDEVVAARDRLADAARDGRWADVFSVLDEQTDPWRRDLVTINSARVGGRAGWSPLHQAAHHGADEGVVDEMLRRGAWRSLRSSDGETPADVAARRGHDRLSDRLGVDLDERPSWDTQLADLETYLAALITVRTRQLEKSWRTPQLGPLVELPGAPVWCPIPGMYGGFAYRWLDPEDRRTLEVESWSRVVGGSGQRHHVSGDGVVLVEDGFV